MRPRVSVPVFLLLGLTAAGLAGFVYFGQTFPPQLALGVDASGGLARWMDRVMFIVVFGSLSFMLPAFVAAMVGVLPRVLPVSALVVPNAAYWRTPERGDVARDWLLYFGAWLGCVVQIAILTMTALIVRANGVEAGNPAAAVTAVGAAFAVTLVLWAWRVHRVFARPAA